jgi:thiamine pyrophosphate-dependent acetolactate synthase large subunit-like protein
MKRMDLANEPQGVERPLPSEGKGTWGSDCIAEAIRALDIPFVALNPGSSYRGLHDSLVNRLGNERPQMLLCLHEEAAVALAHGWAKVTEQPMLAVVHANVGLMHGMMAVYNAWCDRTPLILLGANGPVDATQRRPWIDWIHTTRDNGQLLRNFTKWDDQPASVGAAYESILRARKIAATSPRAPTYVVLDVSLQEQKLEHPPALPDPKRYLPPAPVGPAADVAEAVAKRMLEAERPLILMGRVSRSEADWAARVKLAETLGAVVMTDLKLAAAFPTDHALLGAPPGTYASGGGAELMRQADAILLLDWVDPAGAFKGVFKNEPVPAYVMNVSLDQHLHLGWSMDYQGLPPADLSIMADADPTAQAVLAAAQRLGARKKPAWPARKAAAPAAAPAPAMGDAGGPIAVPMLAAAMQKAVAGRTISLIRHPLSWAGHLWPMKHPLDHLGSDGGGGVGSGPGTSVGAALALRDRGRLAVTILGDGDFMMGSSAIWTAVHYKIPLLIVVANNRSFYNDELHQERMARERGRPVENKWIGQQMKGPEIDLAMIGRAQGAKGFGPVTRLGDLGKTLDEAVAAAAAGEVVVVDVRVEPGYDQASSAAITRANPA